MLQVFFHSWERSIASATKNRVVRPFEWGLDWLPGRVPSGDLKAEDVLGRYVDDVMRDTEAFFTPAPTDQYALFAAADDGSRQLTFPSASTTPHRENNQVSCRFFPAVSKNVPVSTKAAVLVLPQWNSTANGHVGLARLLAQNGMSTLRLTLPYHENRMPPELMRADYIVSSNIARTLEVCRQAVLDARRAIAWLHREGFTRIGVLGSSLGSCLSLLTTAHEPLVQAQALNHISPFFADVVWRGLSTAHVRQGLDGHITLDRLRDLWKPISPWWYLDRLRDRQTLLVYTKYDLTFPVDLSRKLVDEFARRNVPHQVRTLPCGHYTVGKSPFKYVDGWILMRFLKRALVDVESRHQPRTSRDATEARS